MFSGLMQDWVTNDGNGTTPFVQSRSGWMDLAAFGDVTFWLDVRSVSPPGAGSVTLAYETSPTMDESAFKALASITLTTSPNPSLTHVALASNPGLGRYVRWKLTGTAAGNWSATFRIFVAAGVGAGGGAWSPTNATVPVLAWYRADTAHDDGGGTGEIDVWPDQSGAGDANRNQVPSGAHGSGFRPIKVATDPDYGGRPSVQGSGTQFLQSTGVWSLSPAVPITILVIGKVNVGSALLSGLSGGGTTGYNLLWSNFQFYNAAFGTVSATGPLGAPTAIMFEDDGTASAAAARLYFNDLTTSAGFSTTSMTAAPGFDLLKADAGVGNLNGSEAEVVIFAGILTPSDKANLVRYLNVTRAYGIAVT
jgi:hypothetical protein